MSRFTGLVRSRLVARGTAALVCAGLCLPALGTAHAAVKPDFRTNTFHVVSVGNAALVVQDGAGNSLNVTVDPSASLHRRFYGTFPLAQLGQIEAGDRIQISYRVSGPGSLTAYMIQDYSLQVAHTEVKGQVTSVAADYSSYTLTITRAFGDGLGAFHAGEAVTVYTPNPAGIPVAYTQGGPTCGNASCMATGIYLELYGRSDSVNLNINDPRSIVQVAQSAPQVVHATTD